MAYIEKPKNVSGNARVFGNAWVFGNAQVSGDAWVFGDAWVSGNAQVSGDAWVSGNARVSGDAWVFGNARVFGNAQVSGDALITTSQGCMVAYFKGRSGVYALTLYRTKRGNVQFNWGCRKGDDLRAYLAHKSYAKLRMPLLHFLTAFETANPVVKS